MIHQLPTQLVIARYQESLLWLKRLSKFLPHSTTVWIYDKDEDYPNRENLDKSSDLVAHLSGDGHRCTYRYADNQGREGETYLQHLIGLKKAESYTPMYILFLQGNPFDHIYPGSFDIRNNNFIGEYFHDPRHNSLSVGQRPFIDYLIACDHEGNPNHPGLLLTDKWHRLMMASQEYGVFIPPLPAYLYFAPGAQFSIYWGHYEWIPVEFWQMIRDWLLEDEINGYCLERFWFYIFQAKHT